MGLVVFEGGPLNGTAYDTKDLLGLPEFDTRLADYAWTSERRTSAKTGAIAQVWRFREDRATAPEHEVPSGGEPWVPGGQSPDEVSPVSPDESEPGVRPEPGDEEGDFDKVAYGAGMRRRRDAMKVTRAVVVAKTGINASRLYAIEMGTGKPITSAERESLETVISKLEEERGASAH